MRFYLPFYLSFIPPADVVMDGSSAYQYTRHNKFFNVTWCDVP